MRNFFKFIHANFSQLRLGLILTFLSSFGQTYVISLYVINISREFGITEGEFGAIYSICTVISSVVMLSIGHTVDHIKAKKVISVTLSSLMLSALLMGFSVHLAMVVIALVGLRLCGQGMMTHISFTLLSKLYTYDRGKAVSFTTVGFSLGEAIFPLIITFIIGWLDWRWGMYAAAIFLTIYLIRIQFLDLSHFDEKLDSTKPSGSSIAKDFKSIISEKKFSILLPSSMIVAFTATAVVLYQYVFVEDKGWSPELYAAFFTGYAVTRLLFSLFGGVWVDRFTAKRLFRFYLIPMLFGLLAFGFIDSIIGGLLFLISMGITVGSSGTIKTSVLAEVYGVQKLGRIRSLFTMFAVLSTALGPLLVGWMIDRDWSIQNIMLSLFGIMFLCFLNSQRIGQVRSVSEAQLETAE